MIGGRLLRDALRDLWRHPLQNALTALTMLIGVASIVLVSAGSSIATDSILAEQEQQTARAVTYLAQTRIPASGLASTARAVADHLRTRLGGQANVLLSETTPMYWGTPDESADNLPRQGLVVTWDLGDLTRARRVTALSGTFPLPALSQPPLLAVNETVARQLGYPEQRTVVLSPELAGAGVQFTIGAVVSDGSTELQAFGTMDALAEYFPQTATRPTQIQITAPVPSPEWVGQAVDDTLADAHLPASERIQRYDTAWRLVEQIDLIRTILLVVAVVMLGLAALGILNVGLSSVRERSKELVIRRALGARRRDVFGLVTGSAVLLALIVTVLAIVLTMAGVEFILPRLLPAGRAIVTPPFPTDAAMLGCAAAVLTALIGSAAPAWKATRLDVADALRT
jgi:putative ABC transport system permease protein